MCNMRTMHEDVSAFCGPTSTPAQWPLLTEDADGANLSAGLFMGMCVCESLLRAIIVGQHIVVIWNSYISKALTSHYLRIIHLRRGPRFSYIRNRPTEKKAKVRINHCCTFIWVGLLFRAKVQPVRRGRLLCVRTNELNVVIY